MVSIEQLANAKRLLESFKSGDLNFDEALAHTKNGLLSFGIDVSVAENLVIQLKQEEERERSNYTKLVDLSASDAEDLRIRQWYTGKSVQGGLWESLKKKMEDGNLANAVPDIDHSSGAIVARLAEPKVNKDKRLGLVVGNVQSGKTANYAAVISKALDHGYKFVIVLSGIHNNLRKQTQKRLERDLGVRKKEDKHNWFVLTSPDEDLGGEFEANVDAMVSGEKFVFAVVKKNKNRLENLLRFLRAMSTRLKETTPILIIDDESDQATPDGSSDSQNNPTTINRLMRQIWEQASNGSYVGYTATPFANIFTDPDPVKAGQLEHLYPRDFVLAIPTSDAYFGAEKIFGLSTYATEEIDASVPDVIRHISDDELPFLAPKGSKEVASFEASVTDSLANAIRWFVVSAAIRRIRGQHTQHSSMLVHTTHRVDPHFLMQSEIQKFLHPMVEKARNGDVHEFHSIFESEYDRAAELYTGADEAATWPKIEAQIPNVLRTLKVVVDNGMAPVDERLDYSGSPQTVIVIGGGTLSRGLTLEGLFVSFFTRTSNTYDTLLQMGRWFGYRQGFEDLQRIWLSSGLADDYRFLATVESELREDIDLMIKAGKTPREIGVRVLYHPGRLQVTSRNKMKHAKTVAAAFDGYRDQTYIFNVEDEANINRVAVESLIHSLSDTGGTPLQSKANGPVLFRGVPLGTIKTFFDKYRNENKQEIISKSMDWVEQNLPNKKWNVVLAAGSVSNDPYNVGQWTVNPVRRAPIKNAGWNKEINIRALMTGEDRVLDLRLQNKLQGFKNSSDAIAQRGKLADGAGLLILYPISRKSKASITSKERSDMAEELNKIKPGLSDDDQGKPIFGIGFVTPSDLEGKIKNKGTYVSVTPVFKDEEDLEEHAPVDTENDYSGEQL